MDFTYRKTQRKPKRATWDRGPSACWLLRTFWVPQGSRNWNPLLTHHPRCTEILEAQMYLCWWQNLSTLWNHSDRSSDSHGGRGSNRERQQRCPASVSVYGVGRGEGCGAAWRMLRDNAEGMEGLAGASRGHRRARQHGPSLPPSSDGNRAKPGIRLPPGEQGAIPHTGRTLRGDGPISLCRTLQTAGQDGWPHRKGYRDAEGLKWQYQNKM